MDFAYSVRGSRDNAREQKDEVGGKIWLLSR